MLDGVLVTFLLTIYSEYNLTVEDFLLEASLLVCAIIGHYND